MPSRQQTFWNLYARFVQKPGLSMIRPPWLARNMTYVNALVAYQRPKGLTVKPLTLRDGDHAVDAAVCSVSNKPTHGSLLYIHGGAFVLGDLRGYRHLIAVMADAANQRGVYVDYRRAPEHPFPAALDDVEIAYRALLNDPTAGPITLVGDSAGGNLALALLLRIKRLGLPMPAACACMSPVTDLTLQNPSFTANRKTDPLVPAAWGERGVRDYLAGQDPTQPEASPILGDFTGAPPIFINVDRTEILYDDGRLMAAALLAQGIDTTLVEEEGLTHVWHLNVGRCPEADASVTQIARFLKHHTATVDSTPATA